MLDPSHPFSLRKHSQDALMTVNKNIQMNIQLKILAVNDLLSKHLQLYWHCIDAQSQLFIQILEERDMINTRKYGLNTTLKYLW
jgi:hypothetical protein